MSKNRLRYCRVWVDYYTTPRAQNTTMSLESKIRLVSNAPLLLVFMVTSLLH